jgi:hypothetical protein
VRAVTVVVCAALLVAVACLRSVSYECSNDTFCQHAGAQGTCEANQFCSFPDAGCPSGKRYGSVGPLAGQCVGAVVMPDGPQVDVPSGFSIGGTAAGTSGSGLVLRDNGSDTLAVAGNGPFTFAQRLGTGSAYDVVVMASPANQLCAVANFAGTVGGANVTNVNANCTAGSGTGVACNGAVCSPLATKACCHDKNDAGGACADVSAGCGGNQQQERCDDSADCGGLPAVCCAKLDSTGAIRQAIQCVPGTSNCTNGTGSVQYLCDPAAATPCPGVMKCVPDLMHGWHRCQ